MGTNYAAPHPTPAARAGLPRHPFWRLHFLNGGPIAEWAAKSA